VNARPAVQMTALRDDGFFSCLQTYVTFPESFWSTFPLFVFPISGVIGSIFFLYICILFHRGKVEVEIQWTFINICFQKFSLCLSFVVVFSLSRTLTLKSRSLSFSQLVFFLIPSLSLSLSLCACLRERSCAQTKESEGKEFLDCVGIKERRVRRERRELNFFSLLP